MKRFRPSNWLVLILMIGFLSGSMMMTSCDDDDDNDDSPAPQENNDNTNENNAEEGSYELTIEGAINEQLAGGIALFSDSLHGYQQIDTSSDAALSITLQDTTKGYAIGALIFEKDSDAVGAASYDVIVQTGFENVETGSGVTLSKEEGQEGYAPIFQPSGNVQLSTVNEEEVIGTFNNVTIQKAENVTNPQDMKEVTINGSFHAKSLP